MPERGLLGDLPELQVGVAKVGRERIFIWHSRFPVLARIPLLPTEGREPQGEVLLGSLLEAVRFTTRSLGRVRTCDLDADERLATTIRAYERRARTRATPRGAFAGVQIANAVEGPARFRVGSAHRARSMPSSAWLSDLAANLIDDPGVLPRLRLASNNMVVRRGARFEHEHGAGAGTPRWVTLRATPAVALIRDTCRSGATLDDVVTAVTARWEAAPKAVIRNTVIEMVRTGFLLTDLLPDNITSDPLGHVLSKLPEGNDVATTLAAIRKQLQEADLHAPGAPERLDALTAARDLSDTIARQESPITVDVAVDAEIQVPTSLLGEAADAASMLWRISPIGTTLGAFHARFVERYGTGRRVPVLAVVDPMAGLGDPDNTTDAGQLETSRTRTRVLAGLIAAAMSSGETEVVLDESTVIALRVPDDGIPASPSGELYARVVAASQQDREAGRYLLAAYVGCTQDVGSTAGRFVSLLSHAGWDLDTRPGPAVPAEVVLRPRIAKLDTVAVPTGFTRTRICLGVASGPGDLSLDDLEIASDGHRFTLWSRSLDREVVPTLYSRIGPSHIPPAARLLQRIARSGTRPWHVWSWGPLADAPFQPRLRWRRTILSPARWLLPHTLIAASDNATHWDNALTWWRTATTPRPPQVVVAEDGDRRLPLDLENVRDRELLRRYARRGIDAVTEPHGGPDAVQGVVAGPDGDHVLELVIPLRRLQPRSKEPPQHAPARSSESVVYLPGSEWLSCTITSPPDHHDDLLTHISDLARVIPDIIDRWFWLRYDNAANGPHLRVRFNGDPRTLATCVLPAVSRRCASLKAQGLVGKLVVEPYEPEIDRYGGIAAIEAAERLFQADGDLAMACLAIRPEKDRRLVLVALSAVEIARAVGDGDRSVFGCPRLDRKARRHVNTLRTTLPVLPVALLDEGMRQAWTRRGATLVTYRDAVPPSRRADCASSVIHMHANRIGLGPDDERAARALAIELHARNR